MYRPVLGELFLDNAEGDRNAIHLYISQPTPLEEKNLGKVFVLLEFDEAERNTADIIERITSAFSEAYYRSADFEVEAAFERALQKVNRVVKDLIAEYGEGWVYNLNALLGVVHETEVHLSYVGSMEAFLVQGQDIADILQKSKDTEIKPLKLFTNIVSGQCPEKCTMLFATSNLLDYLSLEKIRRVVKENEPENAVAQFENILTENTALSNIAGIILAMEKGGRVPEPLPTQDEELERTEFSEVEDSMERLITQEQRTGDLLAPSIWPTLKKKIHNLNGNRQSTAPTGETQRSSLNYARSHNKFVSVLLLLANFLKSVAIQVVIGLSYIAKQVLRLFKNRDSISSKVGTSMSGASSWFSRLSTPRKILLALFVVVIVIFITSLVLKNRSVEQVQTEENYEQTLTDVENILGEIESKKIMNDEGGARTLISEADTLLNTIPSDHEATAERVANLQSRINDYDNTFNKVTVLSELTEVGNFSSTEQAASVEHISKIGDNIFGFDSNHGAAYRINLADDQISTVLTNTSENYIAIENDSAATTLALLEDVSFVQFNPVLEKTSPVEAADLPENATVTDFDIFGDRLYTLDTTNNQIYRQQQSGDAYGQPVDWVTEQLDLSQAVAFDIDSSIYVLMNSGEIKKLDGGTTSTFTIDEFGPSLAGATRLVKDAATASFYILNPTTQRIVVLTPEGNLDKQLTGEQFVDLKDMVVDEANNALYLLAGNSVLKIDL